MTRQRGLGIAIAIGICGPAVLADQANPKGPAADRLPAGYEILSPDARWCGPRILYFFSCYYGMDRTLDEVVQLCGTDEAGSTSLADLVRAARALGLEPIPVESSLDEVLQRGGPAIVCLAPEQRPAASGGGSFGLSKVHFVALVRPAEGDHWWFLDPSLRPAAFPASLDSLRDRFTGHAVLLKGSSTVLVWPSWLGRFERGVLVLLVLTVGSVVLAKRLSMRRAKRKEGRS